MKFYMLTQMAFWLHCYPELYFMKAKKVFIIVLKYVLFCDTNLVQIVMNYISSNYL